MLFHLQLCWLSWVAGPSNWCRFCHEVSFVAVCFAEAVTFHVSLSFLFVLCVSVVIDIILLSLGTLTAHRHCARCPAL